MPSRNLPRALFSVFLSAAVLSSQTSNPSVSGFKAETPPLPPIVQTTLYSLTAADLKGDVSFLASDSLQGRYTPSPGLDIAAEFVAAVTSPPNRTSDDVHNRKKSRSSGAREAHVHAHRALGAPPEN